MSPTLTRPMVTHPAGTSYSCSVCHTTTPALNSYGTDFASTTVPSDPPSVFDAAFGTRDSDGDGFSNLDGIRAGTFPGNSGSKPATTDTTAPTVSTFTVPATSVSLTVSITAFTATDNVRVTGYMVTESATAPAASATGWSASSPRKSHLRVCRGQDPLCLGQGSR